MPLECQHLNCPIALVLYHRGVGTYSGHIPMPRADLRRGKANSVHFRAPGLGLYEPKPNCPNHQVKAGYVPEKPSGVLRCNCKGLRKCQKCRTTGFHPILQATFCASLASSWQSCKSCIRFGRGTEVAARGETALGFGLPVCAKTGVATKPSRKQLQKPARLYSYSC